MRLPEGTVLQLHSFADPVIDPALDAFLDLKTRPDPLIQASARRTADYLRARAPEFALVMFSRSTCGYCRVQWPIVQRFQDETGWQVTLQDIDLKPDLGRRFGVEVTPTTMLIRRNSAQHMVIATGVEAYPNLVQTAYQAVRLLSGEIRPEQFLTGAGEEGGFFDALSNGPVAAPDTARDNFTGKTLDLEP